MKTCDVREDKEETAKLFKYIIPLWICRNCSLLYFLRYQNKKIKLSRKDRAILFQPLGENFTPMLVKLVWQ